MENQFLMFIISVLICNVNILTGHVMTFMSPLAASKFGRYIMHNMKFMYCNSKHNLTTSMQIYVCVIT